MSKLSQLTDAFWLATKRHAPEILTGMGIAGMVSTTIMAVRATPKALDLLDQKRWEESEEGPVFHEVDRKEALKTVWKLYIPAAIVGGLSIACIVGASSVNAKRNAAIATAYTLSETALKEYQTKVLDTVGDKQEKLIRDAISKDKVDANPVEQSQVIFTGKGETLCFECLTGRYFKSDIDAIKKIENEVNRKLLDDCYISLNEFYYELGLDDVKIGETLGWNVNDGLISLRFTSQLASDGTPCLVLNYSTPPKYGFDR